MAGLCVAFGPWGDWGMISNGDNGFVRRLGKELRLISRFGRVNARAYAAILRAVVAERLWSVPPRVGREVTR
jgi:hypothetical protein